MHVVYLWSLFYFFQIQAFAPPGSGPGLAFICSLCMKPCKTRIYLEDHKRGVHKIGQPFMCICGAHNWWRSNFLAHKRKCPKVKECNKPSAGMESTTTEFY